VASLPTYMATERRNNFGVLGATLETLNVRLIKPARGMALCDDAEVSIALR